MNTRPSAAPSQPHKVLVVDDDHSLRDSLSALLRSAGHPVETFASAAQLLATPLPEAPSCLLLDVRLPGSSGFDVQQQLISQGAELPVIFMTGHGDIPMTVRAMKAGAVDFLPKPFRDQDLLAAVDAALEADRQRRLVRQGEAERLHRYEQLSLRERQVMHMAVTGLMNKQIASELGLSEITVKIHRARAMKKMAARTFAELVIMAQAVGTSG
ncbi:response regulator [Pseudomonas sp. RIT-PI-S]|uniref:response regulator transcription factor n=1 Tax=Pseudomonas sp. RIT-PI-S TaxID=3035295 RepID=UPI0021D94298|nr:response regulator [Pseudomonas sp. RIT-PI-S]